MTENIYNPLYVKALFDEMSGTYGLVNLISSFGFSYWWRKQCVEQANLTTGITVYDWMSGMGECWDGILSKVGAEGQVTALDLSTSMCQIARTRSGYEQVTVLEGDALATGLPNGSADAVIANFGLKTFSSEQLQQLAQEMWRVLRGNGRFSLLEISVPTNPLLQALFLFYLNRLIPLIGQLFLGNPDNYRMLGIYTQAFKDCTAFKEMLEETGFEVTYHRHFFGCATSVSGHKPISS